MKLTPIERWVFWRARRGKPEAAEDVLEQIEFKAAQRYMRIMQRPRAFTRHWHRWFPTGLVVLYGLMEWTEGDVVTAIRFVVLAGLVHLWSWNWWRLASQTKAMGEVVKYWTEARDERELAERFAATSPRMMHGDEKHPERWRSVVWWLPPEHRTELKRDPNG